MKAGDKVSTGSLIMAYSKWRVPLRLPWLLRLLPRHLLLPLRLPPLLRRLPRLLPYPVFRRQRRLCAPPRRYAVWRAVRCQPGQGESLRSQRSHRQRRRAGLREGCGQARRVAPAASTGTGNGHGVVAWPKVDFSKFGPVEELELTRIQKISGPALHRNWAMIPTSPSSTKPIPRIWKRSAKSRTSWPRSRSWT